MITQYFRSITAGATTVLADTHGSDLQVIAGTNITLTADPVLGQLTIGTSPGASFPIPITQDNSTNATNYVVFNNASSGDLSPRTDTDFYYNPATGVLAVSAIRFGDTTIASTASEALAIPNFNFKIAGDDSTQRTISLDETVQFVGTGGIGVTTDAEGKVTITTSPTPTITGGTINNAIIGGTTPAAGTFTTLTGGSGSANFIQTTGAATTLAPQFQALGSDTNVSLAIQSKGTGAVDLVAGSSGVNISNGGTVTNITRTVAGVNYITAPLLDISAPTTAGGVQATATCSLVIYGVTVANGGTGYTVGDTLTLVGGTPLTSGATYTVATAPLGVVTSVNYLAYNGYSAVPTTPAATSGGTGSGCTLNLTGVGINSSFTITNVGSGYIESPTITFSGGSGSSAAAYATVGNVPVVKSLGTQLNFATAGGTNFAINDSGISNPATYGYATGGTGSAGFGVISTNSNAGITFTTKGTSSIGFYTNSYGSLALNLSHTASAVNFIQVTGSTTANDPIISVQGTDSTRGLRIQSKGTSFLYLQNNLGTTQFSAGGTSAAVNYLNARGNAIGNGAALETSGSDTNIAMQLISKGTGAIDLAAGSSGINISNGNTITAITTATRGSGYTAMPSVNISVPTTSSGVQAIATALLNLNTLTLVSGGTGYTVNDVLTVSGVTGGTVQLTVNTVSSGVILTFTITNFGSGIISAIPSNPVSVTGGTGSSATFTANWNCGNITVGTAGSGYIEQPTVTITGGASNGTAYATVGTFTTIKSIGSGTSSSVTNSGFVFQTPNTVAPAFIIREAAGADSFLMVNPQTGYTNLVALGGTNAALGIYANGAGSVVIGTAGTSNTGQFRVTHTASAVNFSQVTGATQGTGPTLSVGGTDAINDLNIQPAGVGKTNIRSDLSVKNVYAQGGNNLVVQSQDITNVAWGKSTGLSVGSSITAPDGTATANSLTSSVSDANISQSAVSNTAVPNGVFTLSMWLKVPSGSFSLNIYLLERTGAFLASQTCALTTSWQRFSVTKTMDPYTNGCNIQIGGGNSLSSGRVVHIWGVQLEPGPGVSYYTPTTSAQIIANNIVTASSFRYTNGEVPGYTYQLDDISSRFNGATVSFPLTYNDGTAISPNNPNKVNITVGNAPVKPARYIRDFFNLPEFAVFTQGYVISGSTITFATPPLRGMSFYGDVGTNQDLAPTFTFKQAPFSALNIMSRS